MTPAQRLRDLLRQPGLLELPGCFDAFSALLVQRAGFPAVYLSGFGVSASAFGLPDLGLICFKEMADRAAAVAAALRVPVIADADTGYGGPANVHRTVRAYARAGVAGVQLEDQRWPKRCGHTAGKEVVALDEAVSRIRAAADARSEGDIVIVARTDARAVLGFEEALERCRAFAEAGADVLFLEAPETEEELGRMARELPSPLLVNLVEGGRTPLLPPARLEALGFKIALRPITLLLAAARAVEEHLARSDGGTKLEPWTGPPSFEELKESLGFPALERARERWGG